MLFVSQVIFIFSLGNIGFVNKAKTQGGNRLFVDDIHGNEAGLFYRYWFGEIARFVYIQAFGYANVVG